MSSMQTSVDAVRKSLVVNCDQQRAFETFTRGIGSWWPLDTYSMAEDKEIAEVIFEEMVGGRIFERYTDGSEKEWGRVLAWEPPARFVMSWYPTRTETDTTELEVRFVPEGEGEATRVELEHRGWEIFADEAEKTRTGYDGGWNTVLEHYERKLNG
jgi:uncharacterized protein YndB with AHSA1/START domain